jgi:hypothetical protein
MQSWLGECLALLQSTAELSSAELSRGHFLKCDTPAIHIIIRMTDKVHMLFLGLVHLGLQPLQAAVLIIRTTLPPALR